MEGHAVATHQQQSQLRRRIPALVLGALIALCCALPTTPLRAELPAVAPTGYTPVKGEPFFLLSDNSWSSKETARVRIEIPGSTQYGEVAQYGGVDIVVYRVPKPLEFLQQQKNLHRPDTKGRYQGEGLSNTLTALWDRWYKASRRAWQRITSADLRKTATEQQPQLKQPDINKAPEFEVSNAYKPLEGFDLISQFRYPVARARPITPPNDVKLPGSSSEFMAASPGNLMIPVGKLNPGLYLVEAIVGGFRAQTLVFVSDTQAITKTSGKQMLVWTADRLTGRPVPGANLQWSDGAGVLARGTTDRDGIARLTHTSPERSFLLGSDAAGGVFISENFYYDSEIYNTKLYAITDRPLYRPGDEVMVKLLGREFLDARNSRRAQDADVQMQVFDPAGTPLFSRKQSFKGDGGADTRFRLPDNANAGGYDIRMSYRGDTYGAAFRVAEYIKPHFEINLLMSKPELRTNEPITGKVKLTYSDGKPVINARLTLSVRAQQITMVDGEMQYAAQVPVSLEQQEIIADKNGEADISLPAATQPSRYALTVLASDGAAYRVKITREFLVERGSNPWKLTTERNFSPAASNVEFTLTALGEGGRPPARWEAVRLESRERSNGNIAANTDKFSVAFSKPGSYTVTVRDASNNVLGATSHWVAGNGLKAGPGSVEIVLDRDRYKPGDTAEALITFPQPVGDALLTLERDQVEQHALLSRAADWVNLTRLSDTQWRARIPVRDTFSPNITFSVLYTQGKDYIFSNAGLVVSQPGIALDIKPERATYQPGETVNIDINSKLDGKPASTQLVVSVVDEMIYVLQPEIAPDINEFFYHFRRNNVRTAASLSFITYDMARSPERSAAGGNRYPERGVKVLERPRRDDVDTAAWQPRLVTDDKGNARLSFVMPDSLTRWRITVRALNKDGVTGQKIQYVASDKPVYVKWTGPRHFRGNDQPVVDLVVFNRGQQARKADLVLAGAGLDQRRNLSLNPGPNFVSVPVRKLQAGPVSAELLLDGKRADQLVAQVQLSAGNWPSRQQDIIPLQGRSTPIKLPMGARNVELAFAGNSAQYFSDAADDLISYPWGCVEQTASRLIPLSLAYQSLPATTDTPLAQPLARTLQTQRQRLIALAGPEAAFGWWGNGSSESLFLTGYAYYADWYASRALGLQLPAQHWESLSALYAKHASTTPALHRALVVWWMRQMGLPVETVLQDVERALDSSAAATRSNVGDYDSVIMAAPDSLQGRQLAELIVGQLRRELRQPARPASIAAATALRGSNAPLARALLLLGAPGNQEASLTEILGSVREQQPTIDRALTLVWLQRAVAGSPAGAPGKLQPEGWRARTTLSGNTRWQWENRERQPETLSLANAPATPGVAVLRYDTDTPEPHRLNVGITRTLYQLVEKGEAMQFQAVPVSPGTALRTDKLYVDEVRLTPRGNTRPRYGLLEVALPPGAEIEGTSWGLQIEGLGGDEASSFERPPYQMSSLAYGVPVESLDKPVVLRQLVRFGQRGRFTLPPARFHRMYQPNDKAFQNEGKGSWQLNVE
ncbi:alpha-2-macroglobulin [Viridibacterium curvum]|uniref:Alpha-2-macroglobulin MagD n=1 Tax=Viridibacterium curvum TaxID=1101404 RepID=A0ABP9QV48_9RHOO